MNEGIRRPIMPNDFAEFLEAVTGSVDISSRLPQWPFQRPKGYARGCEFDYVLSSSFAPVIEALANYYCDETVTLMTVDPTPEYYRAEYGYFPSFQIDRGSVRDQYWLGLSYEPADDPTGAIAYTANVIALTGSSASWSLWAQRDWEIALLLTDAPGGSWLESGVRFSDISQVIMTSRAPSGWSKALTENEIKMLLENATTRGQG